jgi:hypothetical protein
MTDRVAAFLEKFTAEKIQPSNARGRVILGLDATGSREATWDLAMQWQSDMFHAAANLGSLDMQLIYFRGHNECKNSPWVDNPLKLESMMRKIRCDWGETQIRRVLEHFVRENNRGTVNAAVFIGDCFEERNDQVFGNAKRLGELNVPVFMFQEGNDPTASRAFREIAQLSGGSHHKFNQGSAARLVELLKAIAIFAIGGRALLEAQDPASARLLLGKS